MCLADGDCDDADAAAIVAEIKLRRSCKPQQALDKRDIAKNCTALLKEGLPLAVTVEAAVVEMASAV